MIQFVGWTFMSTRTSFTADARGHECPPYAFVQIQLFDVGAFR